LMDGDTFDFKNLTDTSGSADLEEQISWQPVQMMLKEKSVLVKVDDEGA